MCLQLVILDFFPSKKMKTISIDYMSDQNYVKKNLTPVYTELIFMRLRFQLPTESEFTFSNIFFWRTDGCTMDGSLYF